mgnify:CR=1 FL=1
MEFIPKMLKVFCGIKNKCYRKDVHIHSSLYLLALAKPSIRIDLMHMFYYVFAVEEALSHPYLASLHDINDEPSCHAPFNFDFEQPSFTEDHIKELIWQEAVSYNTQNMME